MRTIRLFESFLSVLRGEVEYGGEGVRTPEICFGSRAQASRGFRGHNYPFKGGPPRVSHSGRQVAGAEGG